MGSGMYVRQTDYHIFSSVMNMSTWMYRSRVMPTDNFNYIVSGRRPGACTGHPHAGTNRVNPGGIHEWDPPPR